MSSEGDIFDRIAKSRGAPKEDAFDRIASKRQAAKNPQPEESFSTKATRAISQIPQGLAQASTPGMAATGLELFGKGEALAELEELEDRIPELMEKFPQAPWPKDFSKEEFRKRYLEGLEGASETFPTVSNIAKGIESSTGIPLEPKTKLDKFLRFTSEVSKFGSGDVPKRIGAGLKGASAQSFLQDMGIPEPVADALSLYFSLRQKTPPVGRKQDAVSKLYSDREAVPPGEGFFGGQPPPDSPPPSAPAETLVKNVTGENLPVSKFETAEKALEEIGAKPKEIPEGGSPLGVQVSLGPEETTKSLQGVVHEVEGPGAAISPVEFESEAVGGRALNSTIRENAATSRKEVSEAYKAAEDNYQNINSVADQYLIDELKAEADKIRKSAKPNTAEATVLKTIDDIVEFYLTQNWMPVSRLIRTSDSVSGMSNYELPFTGPKDVLKTVAKSLDNAALRAIKYNGGNPNLQIIANKKYGEWANKYANDDISPFLEKTVNNPESLFRKSISDEGAFRTVESALHESPKAKEFSDALARKIAEKRLGKFKADEVGSKEYNEAARNLKALIGDKRVALYEKARREQLRIPKPRATSSGKAGQSAQKLSTRITSVPKSTKVAEKIARYQGKDPEKLLSMLHSRSGIKQLKKDLSPQTFDTLVKQEAKSILHEGKVQNKVTGQKLYEILNKENNFEIFTEILGESEANALRQAAKSLGEQEITQQKIVNFFTTVTKEVGKATLGVKAFKIITALL